MKQQIFKKYAQAKVSRRQFLSGSAILGASAVVVAVAPHAVASASKTVVEVEQKKDEGYRLTQHIADYYKSAAL